MIRSRMLGAALALAVGPFLETATAQIVQQPAAKAMKRLASVGCTLTELNGYRKSGDFAALQTCARILTCSALEMDAGTCKKELAKRPVEFVAYVPGATETYDLVRVLVLDHDAPVDASLKGNWRGNKTVFRQVFIADRLSASLTSRYTTTPEVDPRLAAASAAASKVAEALTVGIGGLRTPDLQTTSRTEPLTAPPVPPPPAPPRTVCGDADPNVLYGTLDSVTVPQKRATIKILDSVAIVPTCGERYKATTEMPDVWRRSVGFSAIRFVEDAAAAAGSVLKENSACHVVEKVDDCNSALVGVLDTVFARNAGNDPDAVRAADQWVRGRVLGSPQKISAEYTIKTAPRDWWSVGLAQAYMFHKQKTSNVNVKTTDDAPPAYKADPFDHALTMVTVNFSVAHDAASVSMSKAERIKLMLALPITPAIGIGAGLGFYPTRAIGFSVGYARLVTKRPTSAAIGESVRETGNPFTHGWLDTGFAALNVRIGS